MAPQTFGQTLRCTYNPFTKFTIGETSHHGNDGRKIHLGRTSHEGHHHRVEQQPPVRDTRSIIRAIRDKSNTQKRSENKTIRGKHSEQEFNHGSSDAEREGSDAEREGSEVEREGSDTRKCEIGRLHDKGIQKMMKKVKYYEKQLANERRRLQECLVGVTPPRDRSHHRRSPSQDRSQRRRRSRSMDRHHHKAPGGLSLREGTPSYDKYDYGNNGRGNNGVYGGRRGFGGDDDDYTCRHNDYDGRNNDDDSMGYNNNQHDDETYAQLGRTIQYFEHDTFGDLQTQDYGCYANQKHLEYY